MLFLKFCEFLSICRAAEWIWNTRENCLELVVSIETAWLAGQTFLLTFGWLGMICMKNIPPFAILKYHYIFCGYKPPGYHLTWVSLGVLWVRSGWASHWSQVIRSVQEVSWIPRYLLLHSSRVQNCLSRLSTLWCSMARLTSLLSLTMWQGGFLSR